MTAFVKMEQPNPREHVRERLTPILQALNKKGGYPPQVSDELQRLVRLSARVGFAAAAFDPLVQRDLKKFTRVWNARDIVQQVLFEESPTGEYAGALLNRALNWPQAPGPKPPPFLRYHAGMLFLSLAAVRRDYPPLEVA